MKIPLLEEIHRRVVLADGAMGTQLLKAGLKSGGCGELWNIEKPEAVKAIQSRYREAGSDILLTNTFGASRLRLEKFGLANRAFEINRAAALMAREVMGPNLYVLGDIGPFGGIIEPAGDVPQEDAIAGFEDQARAFTSAAVDGIIIETMTSADEILCALEGVRRAAPGTPTLVSLSFDKTPSGEYRTMMGMTPADAAELAESECVDVIGCNCGAGMEIDDYARIVQDFRARTRKAVIVQPNAGLPELVNGKIVYRETPEMMASGIPALVKAGANIIGGCCGTSPEHIRLFKQMLDKM
ncbi:MAG: homocysteine S-methyltransferase family protein [bacterium]|nr:homocysteine S-methyltransferase family protein [Candidatus Sumerlaeota bacterium]